MRAGVTELRNTPSAARKRHLANAYKTPSGRRVSSNNDARRRRRRAASAEGASRTPSRGRVITASKKINSDSFVCGNATHSWAVLG